MADQNVERFAWLDRLDTAHLKELLRADIESDDSGGERQEAVFHILELIERREQENPDSNWPDPDAAWAEFQQYYNIPEGDGISLYPCGAEDDVQIDPPCRPHRGLRYGLAAAVTVAVLLGGMVMAQAAGINVFGAVARWTDETFWFATGDTAITPAPEYQEAYQAIRTALREIAIPEDFAPTWIPDGFKMKDGDPNLVSLDVWRTVNAYFENKSGQSISLAISYYPDPAALERGTFEKDDTPVEIYTSNDKTFYLMSNIIVRSATWSDGKYMIDVWGDISTEDLKHIVDSIGG